MMSAEKVFFSHPECHGEGHRKKLLLKIEKNLIQYCTNATRRFRAGVSLHSLPIV